MNARAMITTAVILLLGVPVGVRGEVREHRINDQLSLIMVENEAWQPEDFEPALVLRAKLAAREPTIDGSAADAAWEGAAALTVPLAYGGVNEASLKAVYTAEEVFLMVSWRDPTRDDQHHPWVWDEAAGRYVEGQEVEDALLVSIEGGCDWHPSLLAGSVYDFDGWLWLAARSNPIGQAVDTDGSTQNRWVPNLGFVKYQSRNTKPFWNVKFTDRRPGILTMPWQEIQRVYKLAPIDEEIYVRYEPDGRPPPEFAQRREPPSALADTTGGASGWIADAHAGTPPATVPQYVPVKLTGDAGEVAARGQWADGRWTVEFRRALVTPARTSSDSLFTRVTQISIHVFDHTERADEASESGRLWLQFEPAGQPAKP